MNYETMTFEVADSVATITLNRPDDANALNLQMSKDLFDVAVECDENTDIRAVILTGTGKMFCAGGDIAYFSTQGEKLPTMVKHMTMYLHGAVSRLNRMDAPVICAVNGTAAGAGFSLAIMGDIVMSADHAKYTMAYTRLGVSPDGSSSYFLPRRVGTKRALDLMLTNRLLSASEAESWGMVDYVHPGETLMDEARKMAAMFAEGPSKAYGRVKNLIHDSMHETLESQMERETVGIAESMRSADGREGVDAFVNKRKAGFTGK
jgi:2-(1,2-epoxy-1,2-dihydrophenyl)acetyl-CoA isomerase